jgi:dienelactone hydrolase
MFTDYRQEITIPYGSIKLTAELVLPANADSIIIFSQDGGLSLNSSSSRIMADYLHQHAIGTLLPNLLTPEEERDLGHQFNVALLTRRLIAVTQWVLDRDLFGHYRLGYYGTSAGAAAALQAAAAMPGDIGAIVSRRGRPDLVSGSLSRIEAPTLLIAGSLDHYVLNLNMDALDELTCTKQLEVIQDATYLFEGDKMNELLASATAWFTRHLHASKVA